MIIREYRSEDEQGWLQCRLLAFLTTSYYDDVKQKKPQYKNESFAYVALENETIIGLIDVEVDSEDITCCTSQNAAMLQNLAVMPEYQHKGIAEQLWKQVLSRLIEREIYYIEVWTQEDKAANEWYLHNGFSLEKEHCWLRCYLNAAMCKSYVSCEQLGQIIGPQLLMFAAKLSDKERYRLICERIEEVRLYSVSLDISNMYGNCTTNES